MNHGSILTIDRSRAESYIIDKIYQKNLISIIKVSYCNYGLTFKSYLGMMGVLFVFCILFYDMQKLLELSLISSFEDDEEENQGEEIDGIPTDSNFDQYRKRNTSVMGQHKKKIYSPRSLTGTQSPNWYTFFAVGQCVGHIVSLTSTVN